MSEVSDAPSTESAQEHGGLLVMRNLDLTPQQMVAISAFFGEATKDEMAVYACSSCVAAVSRETPIDPLGHAVCLF